MPDNAASSSTAATTFTTTTSSAATTATSTKSTKEVAHRQRHRLAGLRLLRGAEMIFFAPQPYQLIHKSDGPAGIHWCAHFHSVNYLLAKKTTAPVNDL